jgi:hypothetical protein
MRSANVSSVWEISGLAASAHVAFMAQVGVGLRRTRHFRENFGHKIWQCGMDRLECAGHTGSSFA